MLLWKLTSALIRNDNIYNIVKDMRLCFGQKNELTKFRGLMKSNWTVQSNENLLVHLTKSSQNISTLKKYNIFIK